MSDFSFRVLEKEDLGKFKDLHNTLFKNTAMTQSWWEWYKDIERFGQPFVTRVYGAFDGENLIGIWCVEPKDLTAGGKNLRVGRCFSVGIHPGYQRKGLFVKLSTFAIENEKEIGQYEYILGFPQVGRSVIEGHIKSGWHRVQVIQMRSVKIADVKPSVSLSDVQRVQDFTQIPIHENVAGDFSVSPHYRNRKWIEHPDNSYICLSRKSSFIVIKVYKSFCHILDIGGDNENISFLLEAAKTLVFRHRWDEITSWCASNDPRIEAFESAGFREGSECGTSVELLAVRINAKEDLALDSCCFQMGVEEIY